MKKMIATAFWTSFVSYGVFGLAEYVRPGFVSHHFSLHWFFLLTLVCGVWWATVYEEGQRSWRITAVLVAARALLSMTLFFLLWQEGQVFGDARFFLALVAAAFPWVVSSKHVLTEEYE